MKTQLFFRCFFSYVFLAVALFQQVHAAAESDVVVGYSEVWKNGMGGEAQVKAAILNQFAGANTIAENSGSPHRMKVVGMKQSAIDGYQATTNGGMVGWMWNNDYRISDVVDYGNQMGADLIAYVGDMIDDGSAAVAYQPGRYSSYEQGYLWYIIVAHETGGHNFGLDHRDGTENPKTVMVHNYCGGGAQAYFTNPNIWLNGVRLLGAGNCQGSATYGGDDAYKASTTAQGTADWYERLAYGSDIGSVVKQWKFNQTAGSAPAGTVISDIIAGSSATVKGTGASFTGTGLLLPGTTTGNSAGSSISAYIDLPNGIFSSLTNFTLEIWATPQSAKNWMRIVDIGRTVQAGDGLGAAGEYTGNAATPAPGTTQASDNIIVTGCIGTNINAQRFDTNLNGGTPVTADSNLTTTLGQMYHYALTFQDTSTGGIVSWYRNGVLINTVNVAFHASQIEDVNNWLGRSNWSDDSNSHITYHEVRLHSIALNEQQVAGNYRIGTFNAVSTMWGHDAWGNSAFTNGAWEFGNVPVATKDYEVGVMRMRTPRNSANNTFAGKSLSITGGSLLLSGTASSTTTFSDLRMNDGNIIHVAENAGNTQTLAGNMLVNGEKNHIRAENGPMKNSTTMSGTGSMLYTNQTVTINGNNAAFTGKTIVGDGRFSSISIDSEARLGANPATFTADSLHLNRGILYTPNTMTIDDSNRGIRIGISAAVFRPASGTILTLAVPVSSAAAGNTLQTAPLDSNPIAGMLVKEETGSLVLTNSNNSHNGEMIISAGELRISNNGRINVGNHWMPITNNGLFNITTTQNQILSGVISGTGNLSKSNLGMLTLSGANTMSGSVSVTGGTLYANTGNAANNRALSYVSGITVSNTGTVLRASANALFGWDGTQEKPITINTGATILADGGATGDVAVGTLTLAGGTMASTAASTAWGSWRFDEATDKLLVTQNSTVTATNVKFGNAAAAIEVSNGKTLTFSGTITDATSGGISYLTKTGAGTLLLTGTCTHTGATAVNAGTLILNSAMNSTSGITIAAGATLSGIGSSNAATTITGIHAPGYPVVGTQSITGALNYAAASKLKWNLLSNNIAASAFSKVAASAVTVTNGAAINLTLNGTGSTVNFSDAFWKTTRTWNVMSGTAISGNFTLGTISSDPGSRSASNYGVFSLSQTATAVNLTFTPYTPTELWRRANFATNWNNLSIAGDTVDNDADCIPNLLEYALGTNPNVFNYPATQFDTSSGKLKLIFTRNTEATDIIMKVVASENLQNPWADIAASNYGTAFAPIISGVLTNESGTTPKLDVQVTDFQLMNDSAHPRRFLRLEISR